MRNFLDNLNARMATAMVGRYGTDQLNQAIIVVGIVLVAVSLFGPFWVSYLAFAVILIALLRSLSRNPQTRAAENEKYLELSEKPRKWLKLARMRWTNRKTTAYITCPYCKETFTLPKGKGKIRATCPHCHQQSEHTV